MASRAEELVILPDPNQYGFCEGVKSADDLLWDVTTMAQKYGIDTVVGYHDIVHNRLVRQKHEDRGVIFVDDVIKILYGSVVCLSAHGVDPEVQYALEQKDCLVFDAACPLVVATHRGIEAARAGGDKVIYIGHGLPGKSKKLHDEIVGALGHMNGYLTDTGEHVKDRVERSFLEIGKPVTGEILEDLVFDAGPNYRFVSQTTLNDTECKSYQTSIAQMIRNVQPNAEFKHIERSNVCDAVRKRQEGVEKLLNEEETPNILIVVTDTQSANGMGYYRQAQKIVAEKGFATQVFHVASVEEALAIKRGGKVAITSSASTADELTREIVKVFGPDPGEIDRPSFKLFDADKDRMRQRFEEHVAPRTRGSLNFLIKNADESAAT